MVYVVAKAPRPGRSKTRLVPPLRPEEAAALQEAMLRDTLDSVVAEGFVPTLLCPTDDAAALRRLLGPETAVACQRGRGLADALRNAIADGIAREPTAIVSSDIPGLPEGAVREAFAALADGRADVVLGPSLDGGYWLIAMREAHAAPFRGIPWSTPACGAVTAERCAEAGLRVHHLGRWRDVDTSADLASLAAEPTGGPRTRALLERIRAQGELVGPPGLRLAASTLLHDTPWRALLEDRLLDGDGRERAYAYLAVPRAVFVVAVTHAGEAVFVRQYRHPVRDWTLEVAAGTVNDGEPPIEAARRELLEETGGRADVWRHLATFYSSSAHLSLRSDAFLATGVALSAPAPDEDEDLSVVLLPVDDALARAQEGGFSEGQTALALLLAAPHLTGGAR